LAKVSFVLVCKVRDILKCSVFGLKEQYKAVQSGASGTHSLLVAVLCVAQKPGPFLTDVYLLDIYKRIYKFEN